MKQIPPSDDQLGALLRERASYHTAPTALRQALLKNTGEAGSRHSWRPWLALLRPRFAWLAGGCAAGMLALWLVQPWLGAGSAPADMTSLLVDSHLRSLQPNHLADVLSSDRHTVKPWFAGRLDYSPPVRDFASEGFPLAGARLEVLRGRTVAVLVYRHRLHWINMFVVPGATAVAPPRKLAGLRGFQLVQWQAEGIQYTLVSDLNVEELLQLAAIASGAAVR